MKNKDKNDSQEIVEIPLEQIHQLENSRVHYDKSDLSDLMGSIKQHGLMQPVGVRATSKKNEYELLFGNRRFLAIKKLGWTEIPCLILDANSKDDFVVKNLVENVQRVNLSPFEEGRYYSMLKEMGLSNAEIATRVNMPIKKIADSLCIFELVPEEYRDSIVNNKTGPNKKGKINAGVAAKLVRVATQHGKKKDIGVMLRNAREGKINIHQTNKANYLMSQGLSAQEAINHITKLRTVSLTVLLNADTAEKLEKKYKAPLGAVFKRYLEGNSEFKIISPKSIAGAKLTDDKQLSMQV